MLGVGDTEFIADGGGLDGEAEGYEFFEGSGESGGIFGLGDGQGDAGVALLGAEVEVDEGAGEVAVEGGGQLAGVRCQDVAAHGGSKISRSPAIV